MHFLHYQYHMEKAGAARNAENELSAFVHQMVRPSLNAFVVSPLIPCRPTSPNGLKARSQNPRRETALHPVSRLAAFPGPGSESDGRFPVVQFGRFFSGS
jgi:hypothetical protein